MITETEIREVADLIRQELPRKNMFERPFLEGMLALIRASCYGTKNAIAHIESHLPPGRGAWNDVLDNGLDRVQTAVLEACRALLGERGSVSLIPHANGQGTWSMSLQFQVGS